MTFKDGQITEVSAEKGDQVMKDLVFENNGARGLGEVALVSDPSPISQSGITILQHHYTYKNASNHLQSVLLMQQALKVEKTSKLKKN